MSNSSNQGIYPATSPYTNTNIINNKYLDTMNYTPIPMYPSDVYYQLPIVMKTLLFKYNFTLGSKESLEYHWALENCRR